jgi:hypothetical protein
MRLFDAFKVFPCRFIFFISCLGGLEVNQLSLDCAYLLFFGSGPFQVEDGVQIAIRRNKTSKSSLLLFDPVTLTALKEHWDIRRNLKARNLAS